MTTLYTPLEKLQEQAADLRRRIWQEAQEAQSKANALTVIAVEIDLLLRELAEANEALTAQATPQTAV